LKYKCDFCKYKKDDFCVKLQENLSSDSIKLLLGGTIKKSKCDGTLQRMNSQDFLSFQLINSEMAPKVRTKA
jgi:hypothetical protein